MQGVEMANVYHDFADPSHQRPYLETQQLQSPPDYHPDFNYPVASPLQNTDNPSRWEPLLPYNDINGNNPIIQPTRTSKRHVLKHLIQTLWLLEALSLSAGVIFFGVFMHLLVRYDNQLVTKWETDNPALSRLFRTLPSAVSFLTTLMRGAMIYPVASAIGQLKWHYMQRPRRVKAMELMDGASRGYWGAIRLLFSKDCLTSASVGAVILLGSIMLGPFLQNTVQQNTNLVELTGIKADEVLLPVENIVNGRGESLNNESAPAFGISMFSSIQAGWASGVRTSDMRESMLAVSCDYSFCEWTNFSSIAISYTCRRADASTLQDRVSLIKYGVSYQANITNLMDMDGIGSGVGKITRLAMRTTDRIPTSSGFINRTTTARLPLIGHLGIIGYYNGSYEAAECLIYWAVHEFKVFAANLTQQMWLNPIEYNATTTTDLLSNPSSPEPVRIPGPPTCRYNGTETPCTFEIARTFHLGLQRMLNPFLTSTNGFMTASELEQAFSQRALNFGMLQTETFYGDWVKRLDAGWFSSEGGGGHGGVAGSLSNQTSRFLANMVDFMTNNLRSTSGLYVYGAAGSYGPWFAISRRYAVYPGVFLGLSILFVVITAWTTRREPVWKNSALALLYHGFEKTRETQTEGLETTAGMESAAETRVVRVVDLRDGLGTRLRDGG